MKPLFYLAKPKYGGYVTFTAHLLHSINRDTVYKLSEKTEKKPRPFGWQKFYQNINWQQIRNLEQKFICCIEKNLYPALPMFKDNSTIVVHDTVETKKEAVPYLKEMNVIAIRPKIAEYLKEKFDIEAEFVPHPFYPWKIPEQFKTERKGAVSISRIDFDKHTDIIIEANKDLPKPIDIYGKINNVYEFNVLKGSHLPYWKGVVDNSFLQLSKILQSAKYCIDMSIIKHDGGGTQYTFLEAIHNDCALVLNREWIEGIKESDFIEGYNCLCVSSAKDLHDLMEEQPETDKITRNARKLLPRHTEADWSKYT